MRLAGMSFAATELLVDGATQTYQFSGGKGPVESHFCATCGTPLFAYPRAYGGVVVVRANSLQNPADFSPEKSVYARGICSWDRRVAPPTWRPPLPG